MWQTGGKAKQSIRRGGFSLTEDSQTDRERQRSVYTSSCIMLTTNSSNDDEEDEASAIILKLLNGTKMIDFGIEQLNI